VPGLADAVYRNGEEAGQASIVESLGGGVAILDFDRDGQLDLFFPGGGQFILPRQLQGLPNHLLRGLGDFQFEDIGRSSYSHAARHYTHGVAVADFDNDGFPDCLVTGYGGLQLLHNLGDGTFADITDRAALDDRAWSSSAAWADFNGDGHLDLYVCHYVNWSFDNDPYCAGPQPGTREICSPRDYQGLQDSLYLSDGAGRFSDATSAWGLVPNGKGLGVVVADVTGDGLPDVYVGNDTTENFFYRNQGDRFRESAQDSGVAMDDEGIPNGSMGVAVADFNNDLKPDLWAANYERESFALYRNEGQGLFLHVSRPTGITALGGLFVGFGTTFLDVNGSGLLDVVVSNGHVIKYPQSSQRRQQPLLLINARNRFTRQAFPEDHYFQGRHEGRGLAMGDFDQDGHLDLVFTHLNAPPVVLRSTLPAEQRSLAITLIGRRSNREALGAQLVLECDQGQLLRTLNGGGSYLSTHQPLIQYEIPQGWTPRQLTVRWPSGQVQQLPVDEHTPRHWTLLEPNDSDATPPAGTSAVSFLNHNPRMQD
jgi:enediyne biosynthesis protein E4